MRPDNLKVPERPGGGPMRVLIFPGGTEIGTEIRQALAWRKEVQMFSAGSIVSNHAPFAFEHHFTLPSIREPGWVDALNDLVTRLGIEYIFPAYDDVLLALSENRSRIRATVLTSPEATCRIARSKSATYRNLAPAVPVPRVYSAPQEVTGYPVFLKPDIGQGSERASLAGSPGALKHLLSEASDLIIMEYLPGEEYTIDCFSDRERGLVYCGARTRKRTRAGIAMNSEPIESSEFQAYARSIASLLRFHGGWFFQMKRDLDGKLKLLEVAPRVAGTSGVTRAIGVNLPLLTLYEARRLPVSIPEPHAGLVLDRALVNRYSRVPEYKTLYVDLDDTLVVREAVNPNLAALLFQCINRGVKVVLVTRRSGNLAEYLRRYRLSGLFDRVVQISDGEPKSSVIEEGSAVFIDVSFREREEIARSTGVPAFDVSMVEVLLDGRI